MHLRAKKIKPAGMTILEVLFAIMITTIGLLGAISVFPVASEMARKGRLNDEVAICADTAVHKFDAQAMRRPDRWVRYAYNSNNNTWAVITGIAAAGESYCLDPRFYAQNLMPNPGMAPNNVPSPIPTDLSVTLFPSVGQSLFGTAVAGPPRMSRMTLWNNFSAQPMGMFQADLTFGFEDQLVYERSGVQKGAGGGADNSLPAFQIYSPIAINNGANILPGKREEEGKLSWMATLVPKIDQNTGATDDKYVVSTVIFNKRSPNLAYNAAIPHEKSAIILGQSVANPNISDFHGNGFGGGEVTISVPVAGNVPEYLNVRAGDWVMLAGYVRGPVYNGSMNNPPPFRVLRTFKWYRISEADEDPYVNGTYYQRDVTLVGPDWDQVNVCPLYLDNGVVVTSSTNPPDNFADDVEVFIIPNVVAVYERTVRLERDGNGF